jgi:hypothetical protein
MYTLFGTHVLEVRPSTSFSSAALPPRLGPSSLPSPSFQAEVPPGNFPGQQPLLVSGWSVKDVGRWLDTLMLGSYKQAFADGTVDGSLLYDLNDHVRSIDIDDRYE